MDDRQGESVEPGAGSWPTRAGAALAGGLVVIAATIAAPQFVLDPPILAVVLVAGACCGVVGALLSHYRTPSRGFLVLSIPMVFLAITWLRETLGLAPPTLLVGLSAIVVAGTVSERLLESR